MRILITGGAGFIGSHVAAGMQHQGHEVAVVDNLSTGKTENVPPDARLFKVDITDRAGLEQVFAEFRPNIVSHHAAQMDIRRSLREPVFDANVNIVGSLAVLELSVQYAVKKVIFASSGGAIYGESDCLPAGESTREFPISHYGVAKLCVERYLQAYRRLYGLQYVALRYANVFGPRQNPNGEAGVISIFIGQMLRGETPTIFGDGSKTRDYVFVKDVVAANLLALEANSCGTFNIGRGIQISDYDVFSAIRTELDYPHEPKFAPRRLGEVEHIALDASLAAATLGWKPQCEFTNGIARTVAHIREELRSQVAEDATASEVNQLTPMLSEVSDAGPWSASGSRQ